MQQPQSVALLFPEIKELLKDKNYALLKQVMRECNPLDFADLWRRFDEEERLQIFKILPAKAALKLFEILEVDDQRQLLSRLSEDSGAENVTPILENMHSPDLAKIFNKMSPRLVKKMTGLIKRQEHLAHMDLIMQYPPNTVGNKMHAEFVKLGPKITAKQALLRLQAITRPGQKEHLYSLFVTDDENKVLGSLSLQDLVSAPPDEVLSELMTSVEGIKMSPEMDQEEAAQLFSKYGLNSAPIVDDNGGLMGILTLKDILSVIREEATEDIAKMVGTRATEVQERSVFRIVGLRMPWLVVTILGEILASYIIKSYEATLVRVIALASFSPLIAAMGGNVGSQSATIVVRSIALGHINGHAKIKTIVREMSVGLMLGVIYGSFLGVVAYVLYGSRYGIPFSIVVALGMCSSMTIAATMGAIEPIVFERLGIDPATATGPLITTITDILTVFFYFTLATLLLVQVH